MAQIGSLSVKLGLVTVEWDKATADAKRSAKDLQSQFNALGTRVKGLADDFKNAGIAAITIGMGALYHQAVALSDEVVDLSKSFGLSIPEVLAFRNALQSSGGKAENADKAISTLFGKIADAKEGNDKAIAQFEKLGISFAQLKSLSPYESIIKVAEGFKNIGDQFERTKAIKEVFGKAGIGVTMDDIAETLAKGTSQNDKYAESIKSVGKVSDALKENLQNLTVAFADLIAPFAKSNVYSVQQFSDILKGIGAAATVLGIAAVAREILNVAVAIRAAAAAGALFNLTAGVGTPIGLILKAVTTLAAIGTFIYVSTPGKTAELDEQSSKRVSKGTVGVDPSYKLSDNLPASAASLPVPEQKNVISKEAASKNSSAALARQLMLIDIKRSEINQDILRKDDLSNKLALIDLDTRQKILEINSKAAQEKAAAGDNETAAMSAARNAAAGAEIARVRQAAADSKALAAIQDQIDLKKKLFESDLAYMQSLGNTGAENEQTTAQQNREAEDARTMAIYGLSNQQKEFVRLNELANERLGYENTLLLKTSSERDLLLQRHDLEAKIVEYKREAIALGTPKGTMDAFAEDLRKTGQATIKLNRENYDAQKTFSYGWTKAFNDYKEAATNAANQGNQAFNMFTKSMESAIDQFVETGKLSFGNLVESIIKDLLKIELKKQALNLMGSSSGAGGLATMFSVASKFLGFADGGNPPVGVPSMVGERGPELFVPKTAGTIVPNGKLNEMGGTVNNITNYNIDAIDTKSFEDRILGSSKAVWAANAYGNKNLAVGRGRT